MAKKAAKKKATNLPKGITTSVKKKPAKTTKSQCRSEPIKISKKNKFVDNGDFRDPADAKLYVKPPRPRTGKANLVEIECAECGETFVVAPFLVRELDGQPYYKCDRCIIGSIK